MKILMVSKALVVGAYQRKLEEIAAQPGIDTLTVVVPPSWKEPGGRTIPLERAHTSGYDLRVEPVWFNGSFHFFFWPGLGRVLREVRPDVVHIDEEPYNLATALATWQARQVGARSIYFTWQNLRRQYPPPFSTFERYVYRASSYALVGNAEAEGVLRAKGYKGPTALIPQVGVDPEVFSPLPTKPRSERVPRIGYVGRLVEEKGLLVLLRALGGLPGPWQLHVIGSGPLLGRARTEAERLGLGTSIRWEPSVPSVQMPDRLRDFDLLVLPSLTRAHWKEQFGRALVEAMACAVPVVGSSSGEIPNVVGDAGVIVPEGDSAALCAAIQDLLQNPTRRAELGERGRQRVLDRYTHRRVAEETVAVYRDVLQTP